MALTALDALYVNDYSGYEISKHERHVVDEAIQALRQALAQPEQEPVAWMYEWNGRINFTTTDQRPVEAAHPHFAKSTPLYMAPPKRDSSSWVGLTDDEIVDLACSVDSYKGLVQAVEAKLKEKNK
jgi:hypothetical protein